jgi:hypothetical protein
MLKRYFFVLILLILALTACSNKQESNSQKEIEHDSSSSINIDHNLEGAMYNMNEDAWSKEVAGFFATKDAAAVKEAYEIAIYHPDLLDFMPCYCGCGDDGHDSNTDCFVDSIDDQGIVQLDTMGFG